MATTITNFFTEYGKYEIEYKGTNIGNITAPIRFQIIPREIPITFLSGGDGSVTVDYNYSIECEVTEVDVSIFNLFYVNRAFYSLNNPNYFLKLGNFQSENFKKLVTQGTLQITNVDLYGQKKVSYANILYFFSAKPMIETIGELGDRTISTMTIKFDCGAYIIRQGIELNKKVYGAIGDITNQYGRNINLNSVGN